MDVGEFFEVDVVCSEVYLHHSRPWLWEALMAVPVSASSACALRAPESGLTQRPTPTASPDFRTLPQLSVGRPQNRDPLKTEPVCLAEHLRGTHVSQRKKMALR